MDIQIFEPFKAVRLDEEGDPLGEVVTLPGGSYKLMSRFYRDTDDPEGEVRAWLEDARGDVYEARGLSSGPS